MSMLGLVSRRDAEKLIDAKKINPEINCKFGFFVERLSQAAIGILTILSPL